MGTLEIERNRISFCKNESVLKLIKAILGKILWHAPDLCHLFCDFIAPSFKRIVINIFILGDHISLLQLTDGTIVDYHQDVTK